MVTGAASGIGLATVRGLVRVDPGTSVVGVDLAEPPPELDGLPGLGWVQGDVALESTWTDVQAECVRRDPRGAETLVACAADLAVAPFLETSIETWRRLYEINVLGTIRGLQTLIPGMLDRGGGSIAVVCSVDSLYVEEQGGAYATSKAALLQVVRSAALEHARRGLRINAVCPGTVDTPLLHRALASLDDPDEVIQALERRTPTGEILQPDEIAAVLLFLVSAQARGLSGTAVIVDGGMSTTFDFDSSH